jgi:hypothetical protein
MKYKLLLILSLFAFFNIRTNFAQIIVDSHAEIKNVDFNLVNDQLVITYDLINNIASEKFIINVNIFTEAGKKVDAKTFTGAVGENISGGYKKKIIWDISKDIAYLNDKIFIEVEAVHQNPRIINPTSKAKAILLSTIYPGWGSSKTTLKGYHAMKGIVGYGCIAGYFYYSNLTDQSYKKYKSSTRSRERDDLYDKALSEDKTSKILLCSAGAIWLWDYITILAAQNRSQQKGFKSKIVYLRPYFNPSMSYSGISMKFNF